MPLKRILVVAPHSFCAQISPRDCDKVALNAVNDIKKILINHTAIYYVADRLRGEGDYNRPLTDTNEWRIKLDQIAENFNPNFIMEIHSFPGSHPLYQHLWNNANLVIFKSQYNKKFINRLHDIIKAKKSDINILIVEPWHPVAITDQLAHRWHHTLFEFNENDDHVKRKVIAEVVAESVITVTNEISRNKIIKRYAHAAIIIAIIIFIVYAATSFSFLFRNAAYTSLPPLVFQWPLLNAKT